MVLFADVVYVRGISGGYKHIHVKSCTIFNDKGTIDHHLLVPFMYDNYPINRKDAYGRYIYIDIDLYKPGTNEMCDKVIIYHRTQKINKLKEKINVNN